MNVNDAYDSNNVISNIISECNKVIEHILFVEHDNVTFTPETNIEGIDSFIISVSDVSICNIVLFVNGNDKADINSVVLIICTIF